LGYILALILLTVQLIVPKDSATLGFPAEIRLPLNANHMEICKFHSAEDHNYVMVSGILNQILRETLTTALHETR
jgi:hypothetical protein